MEPMALDDDELSRLLRLSERGDAPPWRSFVEGRDHDSGDTVILVGAEGDRREDLYLHRDSGPADAAMYDLVAEARNALPSLIAEIWRLRSEVAQRRQ
jgi:hypothetical protein